MSLSSFSADARRRRTPRSILCLACCLAAVLLIVAPGCGKHRRDAATAEVSGQVLIDGQPLPGGMITFVASDGFPSNGIIDEKGNYKVKAPVGDVSISVDNSMLAPKRPGREAPPGMHHPRPPSGDDPGAGVTGQYVKIPLRYADPSTSGLKYTVKSGSQTYKVELSSALPPPTSGGQ
jgi:hypothetical protein